VEDYVTKPFDPLDLIDRVNNLLARSQPVAEAEGEEPSDEPVAEPVEEPPPAAASGLDADSATAS
jgi:DNA-binding response OmpR family regulator